MRQIRPLRGKSPLRLLLWVVPLLLSGSCSRDSCLVMPEAPECSLQPDLADPPLRVTPSRMSVSAGGSLQVSASPRHSGQPVVLQQGAQQVALGALDSSGQLQKVITPSELARLQLGSAEVRIAQQPETAPLRLYLVPQFPPSTTAERLVKNDSSTTIPDSPVWIGILSNKSLITLNYYDDGVLKQRLNEYNFDGNINIIKPIRYTYSTNQFPNIKNFGISTNSDRFIISSYEPNDTRMNYTRLTTCVIGSSCASAMESRPFSKVASLTSEPQGRLFAGLFEASAQARAYSDDKLSQAVAMEGTPGALTAQPVAVTLGELDGSGGPDLAVYYAGTGQVAVFLQSAGKLSYSAAYSQALESEARRVATATAAAVTMADLDGDGLADAAIGSEDKLALIINQGDGTFKTVQTLAIPPSLVPLASVAIGDLSADQPASSKSTADLAIASRDKQRIGVFINTATY
jgi:hypothetical protein